MAGTLSRVDSLTASQRSARMSRVRSTGNRSTEVVVETLLRAQKITGWRKHPPDIPGRPDFYFPKERLAIFVDGCFWHSCPQCSRRLPRARRQFWKTKLLSNRRRDNRLRRLLVRQGFKTMRVWEHEVGKARWLARLRRRLAEAVNHLG